jgi:hypothetical protein
MEIDASGRVAVNQAVDASAIFAVQSTTGGFQLPRLTTAQRDAIASPSAYLLLWNVSLGVLQYWSGSAWVNLSAAFGYSTVGTLGGTTNYIPKWTSSTTLGDSVVRDDGGFIGINVGAAASARLDILDNGGFVQLRIRRTSATAGSFALFTPDGNLYLYDDLAAAYRLILDPTGHFYPGADNGQDWGVSSFRWRDGWFAGFFMLNTTSTTHRFNVSATLANLNAVQIMGNVLMKEVASQTGGVNFSMFRSASATSPNVFCESIWSAKSKADVDLGNTQQFHIRVDDDADEVAFRQSTAGTGAAMSMRFSILGTNLYQLFLSADGNGIGMQTNTPNVSSLLDMVSTTRGLLIPRMTTTQRDAISSPATGLLIFNTTTGAFNYYTGAAWVAIGTGGGAVGGSGTTNRVAKWTAATTLGDALLSDDGTNVTLVSGQLLLPLGSASAPSYSLTGDLNTGMWSPAADTLAFSTAGTERIRVTSAGDVGIRRTPTAGVQLHVGGTTPVTIRAEIDGGGVATEMYSETATGGHIGTRTSHTLFIRTGNIEAGRIDTSQRWGLGTTSPSGKLHVVGASAPTVILGPFGASAGNTGELQFLELAANGTNYVGFKAPDSIASNRIWTLPSADGTSGQVLQTNGSGVLSFATVSGGTESFVFAWAGQIFGQDVGTVTRYYSNAYSEQGHTAQLRYEIARVARTVRQLRVRVITNTMGSSTTATVMENTTATAISVSIGAATTGLFTDSDSEPYAAGNTIDLRLQNTSGGLGEFLTMSATVEVV